MWLLDGKWLPISERLRLHHRFLAWVPFAFGWYRLWRPAVEEEPRKWVWMQAELGVSAFSKRPLWKFVATAGKIRRLVCTKLNEYFHDYYVLLLVGKLQLLSAIGKCLRKALSCWETWNRLNKGSIDVLHHLLFALLTREIHLNVTMIAFLFLFEIPMSFLWLFSLVRHIRAHKVNWINGPYHITIFNRVEWWYVVLVFNKKPNVL